MQTDCASNRDVYIFKGNFSIKPKCFRRLVKCINRFCWVFVAARETPLVAQKWKESREEWREWWWKLIKITSTVIGNYMSSNMIILLSIRSAEPIFDGNFPFLLSSFFLFFESRCEQVFPFKHRHGFCIVLIWQSLSRLVYVRQTFSISLLGTEAFGSIFDMPWMTAIGILFEQKSIYQLYCDKTESKWHLKLSTPRIFMQNGNVVPPPSISFVLHKISSFQTKWLLGRVMMMVMIALAAATASILVNVAKTRSNWYINCRMAKYLPDEKRNNFRIEFIFSGTENWMPYRVESRRQQTGSRCAGACRARWIYSQGSFFSSLVGLSMFPILLPHNTWITIDNIGGVRVCGRAGVCAAAVCIHVAKFCRLAHTRCNVQYYNLRRYRSVWNYCVPNK